MKLRPPAIPLVTVDPFFSIWSMENELNTDFTRHWTGRTFPMTAGVVIDGKYYDGRGKSRGRQAAASRTDKHSFHGSGKECKRRRKRK